MKSLNMYYVAWEVQARPNAELNGHLDDTVPRTKAIRSNSKWLFAGALCFYMKAEEEKLRKN